jgi:hypothetical protein
MPSLPYSPQAQQQYPPQAHQQQQLQLPSNQLPQRPTQIRAQSIHQNNKVSQPADNTELQSFPTYLTSIFYLHDVHLRLGKVVNKTSPNIIEEENEEESSNQPNNNDGPTPIL